MQWLLKLKKASRAKFLKEYWGVTRGGNGSNQFKKQFSQNDEIAKASANVAEAVGVDATNLSRLLKLNDLIPELQGLILNGDILPRINSRASNEVLSTSKHQTLVVRPEYKFDAQSALNRSRPCHRGSVPLV